MQRDRNANSHFLDNFILPLGTILDFDADTVNVYGNTTASYLNSPQIAKIRHLEHFNSKTATTKLMKSTKNFKLLKSPDILEYKLSKLIY